MTVPLRVRFGIALPHLVDRRDLTTSERAIGREVIARDDRIAELISALASRDQQLAETASRTAIECKASLEKSLADLTSRLERSLPKPNSRPE